MRWIQLQQSEILFSCDRYPHVKNCHCTWMTQGCDPISIYSRDVTRSKKGPSMVDSRVMLQMVEAAITGRAIKSMTSYIKHFIGPTQSKILDPIYLFL